MAGIVGFSPLSKNDALNDFAARYVNGVIRGFGGTAPPVTQTDPGVPVLIEFTKDGGIFVPGQPGNGINLGAAANGEIVEDANSYEGLGLVPGTMMWFRHYNNDLTKWVQGSVNTAGAVMTVTTTIITVGGPVVITRIRYYI